MMEAKNLDVKEDPMDCNMYESHNPFVLTDRIRYMADEIDRVCADAVYDSRVHYEVQTRTEGPVLRVSAFHRHADVLAWAGRHGTQQGEPKPRGWGDTRWTTMDYGMGDLWVEIVLFEED